MRECGPVGREVDESNEADWSDYLYLIGTSVADLRDELLQSGDEVDDLFVADPRSSRLPAGPRSSARH